MGHPSGLWEVIEEVLSGQQGKRHFCRLLLGPEMKTVTKTKYRSLSSLLFGHLQAKCWGRLASDHLLIAPGRRQLQDTQVMRRALGASDVTGHIWLRSLCRFFGGNRSLNKFPVYSAHKQVAGQRLRHQASCGSATGHSPTSTIQVLRFLRFHWTWCFTFSAFWGSCSVSKKLLKWLRGWHIVLMIKCMKHTALALWSLKH